MQIHVEEGLTRTHKDNVYEHVSEEIIGKGTVGSLEITDDEGGITSCSHRGAPPYQNAMKSSLMGDLTKRDAAQDEAFWNESRQVSNGTELQMPRWTPRDKMNQVSLCQRFPTFHHDTMSEMSEIRFDVRCWKLGKNFSRMALAVLLLTRLLPQALTGLSGYCHRVDGLNGHIDRVDDELVSNSRDV
ncbi:uncharacterized protein BCR38DRAFT_428675 [Pseudomassariella vexata]|uniref:Uncharacterized protein n=1 Tax=Pseudomassariella vexata TaxID=1141098 RepID=A0A1Y2E316_9PEZI|nr:uncharacterized protein BCR38DRAFT_428675 [Pseudomassariella vexata]ORY65899.1 hypothetical protein BCR38DRAFT_428675 [Pseudomassariella vexata]